MGCRAKKNCFHSANQDYNLRIVEAVIGKIVWATIGGGSTVAQIPTLGRDVVTGKVNADNNTRTRKSAFPFL